ncbi:MULTISPECIES: hypothetical protein [unclassified Moorena]|uniref:hypothetical protein n=1 Tax=unclassified Moorena TaxID=2683338 RepID=UPI0013BD487D|nr:MULTISPECIES: hypothetical protein [unclassified Moorena]NER91838.1 hypothetical protein [Moorena sp. SIO3A2]NES42368.1 hypothetical protein [Moorena sp. SIO2C4]NET67299.1 hypothetical protein [Moorena sp. SIO1G6]
MTFAQKNVKAFIKLLKNNPDLLNTQDRQTLLDKIPEDFQEISKLLLDWCNKLPEINTALQQVRRSLPDDEPIGERPAAAAFPTAETKAEYEKNLKEELLNALRQSSPPETEKPNTPTDD